jgi:hypothetical protein
VLATTFVALQREKRVDGLFLKPWELQPDGRRRMCYVMGIVVLEISQSDVAPDALAPVLVAFFKA